MTTPGQVAIVLPMDTLQDTTGPQHAAEADAPPTQSRAERRTILFYASVLVTALNFTSPSVGLFVIPLSFILKNKLHLSANGLALFTLWAGVPAYFSFVFGIIRDRWSPLGLGDRGYFILFGGLSALFYTLFSFIPISEQTLLANAFLGVV